MRINSCRQLMLGLAVLAVMSVPAFANEWRGLQVSGMVVKGGYDIWGQVSTYSLLVRFKNDSQKSVRIKMHEIYNSTLRVSFVDTTTGKDLEVKPGSTGDVIPSESPENRESIEIGPGTSINIAIGLDGFKKFHTGKFKGRHKIFELDIPEFEIDKNGNVLRDDPP